MLLDTRNGHEMNQMRGPLGIPVVSAERVNYLM
jgi:hypothetical protein